MTRTELRRLRLMRGWRVRLRLGGGSAVAAAVELCCSLERAGSGGRNGLILVRACTFY